MPRCPVATAPGTDVRTDANVISTRSGSDGAPRHWSQCHRYMPLVVTVLLHEFVVSTKNEKCGNPHTHVQAVLFTPREKVQPGGAGDAPESGPQENVRRQLCRLLFNCAGQLTFGVLAKL